MTGPSLYKDSPLGKHKQSENKIVLPTNHPVTPPSEEQKKKQKGELKEDFSNQSVLETTRRLQKEGHFDKPRKHFFSK